MNIEYTIMRKCTLTSGFK